MDISFQEAFKVVAKNIKDDSGLYYAYQSNIAMAFKDEVARRGLHLPDVHEIANEAAKYFLNNLTAERN